MSNEQKLNFITESIISQLKRGVLKKNIEINLLSKINNKEAVSKFMKLAELTMKNK